MNPEVPLLSLIWGSLGPWSLKALPTGDPSTPKFQEREKPKHVSLVLGLALSASLSSLMPQEATPPHWPRCSCSCHHSSLFITCYDPDSTFWPSPRRGALFPELAYASPLGFCLLPSREGKNWAH